MHDIRLIRLNPEEFDKKMDLRKLSGVSTKILELDKARRIKIKAAEEALAERNNASKKIGKAKADNDQAEFAKLKALVSKKKNEISKLEDEAKKDDKILSVSDILKLKGESIWAGAISSIFSRDFILLCACLAFVALALNLLIKLCI